VTCHAARRLLPLFTGGDLNALKMSAVAGHLAACAACQGEAEAFSAARCLLPLSSLSFGESERAQIRRRVLDEIARRRSDAPPTVAFQLRPRFALAALAGAIVLAASLVSPFFIRSAVEPAAVLPAQPIPLPTPTLAGERIAEAEALVPDRSTAIPRVLRAKKVPRTLAPASEKSGPAMRFEIQTGNVNVRIIWFTGGNSAGEEPSDPSGDPNDVS
jgi:anti-sigma factor RsiW